MYRIFKLYFVVLVIVSGLFLTACNDSEDAGFQEISMEELDEKGALGEMGNDTGNDEKKTEKIFVHVCGEVECPGVYELDAGSRVYEALEAAGGLTKAAAQDSINQAEILKDGQQLDILSEEEQKSLMNGNAAADGKVNINRAVKEELMTLPGIGEAKADAIIRYREEHGDFGTIEEIMEIEGIKEGVFHKIEDGITAS